MNGRGIRSDSARRWRVFTACSVLRHSLAKFGQTATMFELFLVQLDCGHKQLTPVHSIHFNPAGLRLPNGRSREAGSRRPTFGKGERSRDQESFLLFNTCRPLYMPVFRSR